MKKLIIMLLAVAGTAMASYAAENPTVNTDSEEKNPYNPATAVGKTYTDISAADPDGKIISLSSLVGEGKWVLVDFWATWCPPCRAEIVELKKAYAKYAQKGFVVLGVSLDRNKDAWKKFLKDEKLTWVAVNDVNDEGKTPSAAVYSVKFIPTNILISPEGKIVVNSNDWNDVEDKLVEIFE